MSPAVSISSQETRLIEGRGAYVADVAGSDALWLHVVRSDIAHGVLNGIEVEASLQLDGVVTVLSAADLGDIPRIPIRVGSTPILESHLQPVLASERVRYVGEPIAVVVAETPAAAEEAASMVWADISPLSPVNSIEGADFLWDDLEGDVLIEDYAADGDVDAAFDDAAQVVELELTTARRTGVPIEPRGLMAVWESGVLHLWGPTKFVHFTRQTLVELFDLEPTQVVCHRVDVGGMFGVRGEFYPEDFLVPWAAKVTGRRVRWQEQRREHFAAINHAGEQHHRTEVAISADGRLLGLRSDVVLDVGAYSRPIGSRIVGIVLGMVPGPYAWDAYRVRCKAVSSSKTPTGTVRGPAALETTFARERAIDLGAKAVDGDPVEIRRKSLIPPERIPHLRQTGRRDQDIVFDSGDFIAVFDETLKRVGHPKWMAERDRRREKGECVGIGIGTFVLHSALAGEESVTVELETDGRFLIRTSTTEVGQGLDAMARSTLATLLGVDESQVRVWSGDTEAHGEGLGTFASRSTVFVANALVDAAENLRRIAKVTAGRLLGCHSDEVLLNADGPAHGAEQLRWKDVAPIEVQGRFEATKPSYGFGMHVAMVSIDIETGDVMAERMAVAYDCGRALNHANVADQMIGAAVMGVGATLHERFVYDSSGNPVSSNLSDYLIPSGAGLPDIEAFVFETAPAAGNPLGLKGAGEAGIVGVGAAIGNAVADALGPAGDSIVTGLPIDRQAIALHHLSGRSAR